MALNFHRVNKQILCLSAILLLGLLLRTVYLDSKSLYYDEALEIGLAEKIFSVICNPLLFQKELMAEVPLYLILLRLWMFLGKSDFVIRLFSVVLGVFSIFIVYRLAKFLFDEKIALTAAYLIATSPFIILYSRLARMYSLFGFLTISSIYLYLRVLKENKLTLWLAYVVCTTGLIYTHYYAVFIVLFQNLYFAFQWKKSLFKKWMISQVCIAMLFLPWFPIFWKQFFKFAPSIITSDPFPVPFGFFGKFLFTFYTFSLGMTVVPWNIPIVLMAILAFSIPFFFGIKWLLLSNKNRLFFLLSFLLVPVVLILSIGYSLPRYFFNVSPAFYIIIAVGISGILKRGRAKFLSIIVLITLLNTYSLYNYFTNRQFINMAYTEPWRDVVKYVDSNSQQNDVIVHSHYDNPSFLYYYKGNLPNIFAYGDFSKEQAKEILKDHKRLWYISFSSGVSPDKSSSFKNFVEENLRLVSEIRYQKDDQADIKRKYMRKNFLDYRIIVHLYEIDKSSIKWE